MLGGGVENEQDRQAAVHKTHETCWQNENIYGKYR